MSSIGWLIVIFFALCFLVLLVYALVVWAYYWGNRKEPPKKHTDKKVKIEVENKE